MKVVITRPQIDAEMMASQLANQGMMPVVAPLMSVNSVDTELPPLNAYQALIATSTNGVRALGARTQDRDICIFAVGPTTAALARKLKFTHVIEAEGDVVSLADVIRRRLDPQKGPLLHVAGSIVAGDLAGDLSQSGFEIVRIVLYEAVATKKIPAPLTEALMAEDRVIITFFSPRTARIFVELMQGADLLEMCRNKIVVCLSEAVAEPIRPYFRTLRIAQDRSTASMMDLIGEEARAN